MKLKKKSFTLSIRILIKFFNYINQFKINSIKVVEGNELTLLTRHATNQTD